MSNDTKNLSPGGILPTILAAFFLATVSASWGVPFVSNAQSVEFGNCPTGGGVFDFIANGGYSSGAAVAFTPVQNITFGGVTIWLTGYTGKDNYGNSNQSFYAGIYNSYPNSPGNPSQPFQEIASLCAPAPNDGSLAAFTFANLSPTTTLQANTQYWLFVYEDTSGSYNYNDYPQWVAGDSPMGNALYDGSETFSSFSFSPSSDTPAFAVNAVPEPGTTSMMALSLLGAGTWALRSRRKKTA
jgi:hypothetical protein